MGDTRQLKPISMTTQVITAINEELTYQAKMRARGNRFETQDHMVSGYLLVLKTYLDKSIEAWTMCPGDNEALDGLRKVAAVAVRALLEHGCPRRNPTLSMSMPDDEPESVPDDEPDILF
jgi:hypothetical protein